MDPQRQKIIRDLAAKKDYTQEQEIQKIIQAMSQDNDEIVQQLFTRKQWNIFKNQVNKPHQKRSLLFFRYPLDQVRKSNEKVLKAIIMGPCGYGKSTLVNNLCDSQLSAGLSGQTLTRDITEMECKIEYDTPLVFYDTPGTTAHKEKLDHAGHLKFLLEYRPVNGIFVLVKFDSRIDEMLFIFSKHKNMLQNSPNIVYVITHIDTVPKQDFEQAHVLLDKLMKQNEMNNQVIYMSNKLVDQRTLCDAFYYICRSQTPVQLKIEDKTFYKHFNLKKQQSQELYFKKCQKEIIQEMEQIADDYIRFSLEYSNDSDRDNIFSDLQVSLHNQLVEVLEQFEEKYRETMLVTDFFSTKLTLQAKINEHREALKNKIKSFLTHDHIESQFRGQIDIRDLLKKCPNCGLIWFRIEACPNTTCGNRPSCFFDFVTRSLFKYTFFRDRKSKKITLKAKNEKKNQQKNALNDKTFVGDKTVQDRKKGKAVGCGANMPFDTLDRLPNIETLLLQLFDCGTLAEAYEKFNEEKEIIKARQMIEEKARRSVMGFKYH